jgi:hypothetical protein
MEEKKALEKVQVQVQETPKIKVSVPINMDKIKVFFAPVLRFFKDKNNSGKVVLSLAVLSVV